MKKWMMVFVTAMPMTMAWALELGTSAGDEGDLSVPGLVLQLKWVTETPRSISGIYPSLAMFNQESECGTGAVVPWADRLWVITYGPHLPFGSSDKLYEITPDLTQTVRPESVGGTPANRMIHTESNQLFIGPYIIDAQRHVRVIPPASMPGRLTGNARHLTDPADKIYYATMEEGLYAVDVKTLEVQELIKDGNGRATRGHGLKSGLPGYHGKGLYSGQGRLIYANNGETGQQALRDPTTQSGALAEWRRPGQDWQLVRRNQFTEVTGPGGIAGSDVADPIWTIGWDARSLILMVLDQGQWHSFRLPKVSHSYDGAHGWNTEWPRIREIGQTDLLMTMHGTFWRFPRTFSAEHTSGVRARSAYLKVIGDFCAWNDRLVFGCDDSAKSEFLNTRRVKGGIQGTGQSQSNLWFVDPGMLDQLGPVPASGSVWLHNSVEAGEKADPFLIAGWTHRSAWFVNHGDDVAVFEGDLGRISVPAGQSQCVKIDLKGEWLRVTAANRASDVSVVITLSNGDHRDTEADVIFSGLARMDDTREHLGGVFRTRGADKRTLAFAAMSVQGHQTTDTGYYEMDGNLQLIRVEDTKAHDYVKQAVAIPKHAIVIDRASVLITDDRGRRWRLPKGDVGYEAPTAEGVLRVCREVATERDMFSACGTFYELPAENADGFAKIRPIATHGLRIMDYGSHRGLLLMSGVKPEATGEHIIRSADGKAALWAGAIDDLWRLGKPRGTGGPWKESEISAGQRSDPYLMWGYDQRTLTLSHEATETVTFEIELDLTGTGLWVTYLTQAVLPGETVTVTFDPAIQARWLRVTPSHTCQATAQLEYR